MSIVHPVSVAERPKLARVLALANNRWVIVGAVIAVGAVALAAIPRLSGGGKSGTRTSTPLVHTVSRGFFSHNVTEPGEVESSSNLEIRCEVKSRNTAGTTILWIIPNGTLVEPGDLLIKFDASALEKERATQQQACNTSWLNVVTAKKVYETALITKEEYLQGTYDQEEALIESEVFVAEENFRRAQEYARYSERLAAKGHVTATQVDADRFAVEKSRKEKVAAHNKLKVLREFTKKKTLTQLDADVIIADAKLKSEENINRIDNENLEAIQAQIDKCKVKAPQAGKVVYNNKAERRGNNETVIEEGAVIRESQTVLRLPDLGKMQVMAKVNEARINFVKPDMTASVRLDAFSDVELSGIVRRVDEYPLNSGWFSANVKQYAAYIEIFDNHPGLRPGMTAQVQVHIEQLPDALTVPVQAVVERANKFFCLIDGEDGPVAKEITIGSSNSEMLVVNAGLDEGAKVLINPDKFIDQVDLPAATPKSRVAGKDGRRGDKGGPGGSGSGGGRNKRDRPAEAPARKADAPKPAQQASATQP